MPKAWNWTNRDHSIYMTSFMNVPLNYPQVSFTSTCAWCPRTASSATPWRERSYCRAADGSRTFLPSRQPGPSRPSRSMLRTWSTNLGEKSFVKSRYSKHLNTGLVGIQIIMRPLCLVESHTLDVATRQERSLYMSPIHHVKLKLSSVVKLNFHTKWKYHLDEC